jgi:hypothetical protein
MYPKTRPPEKKTNCGGYTMKRLCYVLVLCMILLSLFSTAVYAEGPQPADQDDYNMAGGLPPGQANRDRHVFDMSPINEPVSENEQDNITQEIADIENPQSVQASVSGTPLTWGINNFGQLGNGTYSSAYTPVKASGLKGVVQAAAGGEHALALTSSGKVWAWGADYEGQLGDGKYTTFSATPLQVKILSGITALAAGGYHSLALKSNGTVWE